MSPTPGFLAYRIKHLTKVNAQRRALSQPLNRDPQTMSKGEVQYIPEAQMCGEPATCYNCPMFNYGRTCYLMGPDVKLRKFTYPPAATSDAKPIEYWPCCSAWRPGSPNMGAEKFADCILSVETLGPGWINAPKPGQKMGGANCGGKSGGDDCDHYMTDGDDKRIEPTAFCRVLQMDVENGAVCAAWRDDDWLDYNTGSALLAELENA